MERARQSQRGPCVQTSKQPEVQRAEAEIVLMPILRLHQGSQALRFRKVLTSSIRLSFDAAASSAKCRTSENISWAPPRIASFFVFEKNRGSGILLGVEIQIFFKKADFFRPVVQEFLITL